MSLTFWFLAVFLSHQQISWTGNHKEQSCLDDRYHHLLFL